MTEGVEMGYGMSRRMFVAGAAAAAAASLAAACSPGAAESDAEPAAEGADGLLPAPAQPTEFDLEAAYLPLGSVVTFKDDPRGLMAVVIGRRVYEDGETVHDYMGALYPLGFMLLPDSTEPMQFAFDSDAIDQVVFVGFQGPLEDVSSDQLMEGKGTAKFNAELQKTTMVALLDPDGEITGWNGPLEEGGE